MKTVIQRVKKSLLFVEGQHRGGTGPGMVILVAVEKGDTEKDCEFIASKVLSMRIFENSQGKLDHSVLDIGGDIMVISQFTLCGNCRRGNRPDFTDAEAPDRARFLYGFLLEKLKNPALGNLEQGEFGKYMLIEIHNDGPVTILLNSRQ
jgi:D-tyrosyl-tRNA(Tyr) deacylase